MRAGAARITGAVRFAGFVGVLAIIIGTSVALASADPRERAARDDANTDVTASAAPRSEPSPVARAADDAGAADAADAVDAVTPDPEPAGVAVAPTTTSVRTPSATAPLPLTGDPTSMHVLRAGAAFVLLGMLVQIAGQPLPARQRAPRSH